MLSIDLPLAYMAAATIVLVGLVTVRFFRIRRGIGAPEDWIPLVLGLGATAGAFPLAYLLDQGIIAGSLPRAVLVLILIPSMVIAFAYSGIQSGRLEVRLKRAYAIVRPYLEDPAQAVLPEGDIEPAELGEALEDLHRLLLRGLRVPERPALVSDDLEPLLSRTARSRSSIAPDASNPSSE